MRFFHTVDQLPYIVTVSDLSGLWVDPQMRKGNASWFRRAVGKSQKLFSWFVLEHSTFNCLLSANVFRDCTRLSSFSGERLVYVMLSLQTWQDPFPSHHCSQCSFSMSLGTVKPCCLIHYMFNIFGSEGKKSSSNLHRILTLYVGKQLWNVQSLPQ